MKRNYGQFFALYKRFVELGLANNRKEFLEISTGKPSLKDLTDHEYQSLIEMMQRLVSHNQKGTDQQRKRIISNFYEMGHSKPVPAAKEFVEKRVKKNWNNCTTSELAGVVKQSDLALRATLKSNYQTL